MRDWKTAENHLQEIEKEYARIGGSGLMALLVTIGPLRDRYDSGERTEDLYKKIMALE
jgi:hypothetical protein